MNNDNSYSVTGCDKIDVCCYCLNHGIQRYDLEVKLYFCVMCGFYQAKRKDSPPPRSDGVRKQW